MSQPFLQCSLDWTPYNNPAHKLSKAAAAFVNPINGLTVEPTKVDLLFTLTEYMEKIYITVVKEGDDYGFINDVLVDLTTGVKVVDYAKQGPASLRATLNTINHFKKGDGQYRVGIYGQNSEGFWNYEYFLVTLQGEYVLDNTGNNVMVPVWTKSE